MSEPRAIAAQPLLACAVDYFVEDVDGLLSLLRLTPRQEDGVRGAAHGEFALDYEASHKLLNLAVPLDLRLFLPANGGDLRYEFQVRGKTVSMLAPMSRGWVWLGDAGPGAYSPS